MKLLRILTAVLVICSGFLLVSSVPVSGGESESRYGYLDIGTTNADTSNGLWLRTYILMPPNNSRPKELQEVAFQVGSEPYFGDVDASTKYWIFDAGNFFTAQALGDSIMVLIDWEKNSGTINHRGYFGVLNDTSVAGNEQTYPCNDCTLRVMPIPDTVSFGQAWFVWNTPVQDSGNPKTDNIIGYNIYVSRKSFPFGNWGVDNFQQLNASLVTDTTYSDATIVGDDTSYYAYKIVYRPDTTVAKASKGYESKYLSPNSPKAWLPPTQIELTNFACYSADGVVFITWRTESEDGNFAWRLDRSSEPESGYQTIHYEKDNEPTTPKPSEYSFIDNNVILGETYYYKLADIDMQGRTTWHNTIFVTVGGENLVLKPMCHPNPFNESTRIKYAVTNAGEVTLRVVDLQGRIVTTLINGYQKQGVYSKIWDGKNLRNHDVPEGIYFLKLDTSAGTYVGKLVRF